MKKTIVLLLSCLYISLYSQTIDEIAKIYEFRRDSSNNNLEKIKYSLNLAQLYTNTNPDKALNYMKDVEKFQKKVTLQPQLVADINKTYALIYYKQKDYRKSISFYEKSIKELNKFAEQSQIDSEKYNLATITYDIGDFKTAEKYYSEIAVNVEKSNNTELKKRIYKSLYLTNKKIDNYQKALFYFEKYIEILDQNFWQTTQKLTILTEQLSQKEKIIYTTEKKYEETKTHLTKTKVLLKKTDSTLTVTQENLLRLQRDSLQNALAIQKLKQDSLQLAYNLIVNESLRQKQQEEIENRKQELRILTIILTIIGVSLLIIIVLALIIRKNNKILSRQKEEISYQARLINDSINYASFIQKAVLPKTANFINLLPDSFIFLKPKASVSGDFLWYSRIDNKIIVSAIDCTGHGVPGAFISIVGNRLLNEIVNIEKITKPSEILNNLHNRFVKTMQRTQDQIEEIDDGMDMVLCVFEEGSRTIEYSGAQNNLFIFTDDKLESFSTTRFSIGQMPLRPTMPVVFENKTVDLPRDCVVILMSDGLVDQYDAQRKEKYGLARLADLLRDYMADNKPLVDFANVLDNAIEQWKQKSDQIDDMLVVGFKL